MLQIRHIAAPENVEESAVLRYIVNGLVDVRNDYKVFFTRARRLSH